ncbi:Resolvase domain [Leptothrix cholodnii SP-6]|uniref:Resolvase domain n=1 Tax=Leptothrix cholodnii (strain ATCC 51168 / LMG 8142 / SP-6) TaxID=395495 RepID=B1Y2K6_LEPCP|nr:recombinase family protein [Leptothrix cholodnii]ACB33222.1 Resolvase domain [Leptothrix cholodnii SP-6]
MFIRAYLRASTEDQNADRARADLEKFAADHGVKIVALYRENESGAKLDRPKLFDLINDAHPGDVLLIEQVDRLTRLNATDREKLFKALDDKGILVVSLDLPLSHQALKQDTAMDETTRDILKAMNRMMLQMFAAFSRKDYEDRRRRQAQGIATNKDKFKGRPEDTKTNDHVRDLLLTGKFSWTYIEEHAKVSRSTIAKVAKRINEGA